jgi:hypothetical protein
MATAKVRIKKREVMWRCVVAGHARSGMSIRAYCARNRVKEPAFYWWRAELARRDAGKPRCRAAAFVPVVVAASPTLVRVEGMAIELRGGRVLRLPSMPVSQIVELVCAMEGAS